MLRNPETLLWELQKAETELWKEPSEPLLEEVAKRITKDNPMWQGSPTELTEFLNTNMKPNVLSYKLNILAGRLFNEYGIRYTNNRTHAGRIIKISFDGEQA